jgi:hypothetical protein
MSNRIASHALVLAALVLVLVPSRVTAQGVLDRVKKRAEESA